LLDLKSAINLYFGKVTVTDTYTAKMCSTSILTDQLKHIKVEKHPSSTKHFCLSDDMNTLYFSTEIRSQRTVFFVMHLVLMCFIQLKN